MGKWYVFEMSSLMRRGPQCLPSLPVSEDAWADLWADMFAQEWGNPTDVCIHVMRGRVHMYRVRHETFGSPRPGMLSAN
jgi:hypothetical protein